MKSILMAILVVSASAVLAAPAGPVVPTGSTNGSSATSILNDDIQPASQLPRAYDILPFGDTLPLHDCTEDFQNNFAQSLLDVPIAVLLDSVTNFEYKVLAPTANSNSIGAELVLYPVNLAASQVARPVLEDLRRVELTPEGLLFSLRHIVTNPDVDILTVSQGAAIYCRLVYFFIGNYSGGIYTGNGINGGPILRIPNRAAGADGAVALACSLNDKTPASPSIWLIFLAAVVLFSYIRKNKGAFYE